MCNNVVNWNNGRFRVGWNRCTSEKKAGMIVRRHCSLWRVTNCRSGERVYRRNERQVRHCQPPAPCALFRARFLSAARNLEVSRRARLRYRDPGCASACKGVSRLTIAPIVNAPIFLILLRSKAWIFNFFTSTIVRIYSIGSPWLFSNYGNCIIRLFRLR